MVTKSGMAAQVTRHSESQNRSALAWALLTLFLVLALVAGLPAFHDSVGLTQTDAMDQGITVPSVKLLTVSLSLMLSLLVARFMASGRALGERGRGSLRASTSAPNASHTVRDARSGLFVLLGGSRSGSAEPDALNSTFAPRTLWALRIASSRRITGGSFLCPQVVRMRI